MSITLVVSIAIRLAACGWSARMTWRQRDWRLGFMALMLGLMATRQSLSLAKAMAAATAAGGDGWSPRFGGQVVELPGLAVSVMAFAAVVFLARMLEERKRAADALRQERDFNATLLTTQAALVAVLDPQGHIVRFNAACELATGKREADVRGRLFWDVVLPQAEVSRVREGFERLVERGGTSRHTNAWMGASGEPRLIEWRNAVLPAADGGAAFVVATGIDQTDREALESRLRQAQKMEAVGQLAGGIAHDFNNLLAIVVGHGSMLLEDLPKDGTAYGSAAAVLRAADRAAGLTRQLLNFTRREADAPELVELGPLLRELQPMLEVMLGGAHGVTVTAPEGLPLVLADPNAVEQAVINLAANARDAMPDGGTIAVSAEATTFTDAPGGSHPDATAGEYVVLAVADTGTGIAPDQIEHLFEPFFTTKPRGRGTGLGLAMVFSSVGQASGTVTVASTLGAGSTFRCCLPVHAGPVPAPATPSPAPVAAAAVATAGRQAVAGPADGGTAAVVLLVEDDPMVRDMVERALTGSGYGVLAVEDAESAAQLFESTPHIDMLVTDLVLPGQSGRDLIADLTSRRPELPAILLSGFPDDAPGQSPRRASYRFLAKPFAPSALLREVRAMLSAAPARPPA